MCRTCTKFPGAACEIWERAAVINKRQNVSGAERGDKDGSLDICWPCGGVMDCRRDVSGSVLLGKLNGG